MNEKKAGWKFWFGILLIIGPIVVGALRLAGVRPGPLPDNPVNRGAETGGEIGFWVGSVISIVVGIGLLVAASSPPKE
jgi:hypothetical protein